MGIKIKLSLSSSSLGASQPTTVTSPSSRDKGKGKAIDFDDDKTTGSSQADISTSTSASAGPSVGMSPKPAVPVSTTPAKPAKKAKSTPTRPPKPKVKIGRPTKYKPRASASGSTSTPARPRPPSAIPAHVYSAGPSTPTAGPSSPGSMAPPPLPTPTPASSQSYPFPYTNSPSPKPTPDPVTPGSRYTSRPSTPSGLGQEGSVEREVKDEPMDIDSQGEGGSHQESPDVLSTPLPPEEDGDVSGTPVTRGRTQSKYGRSRKPLKELMGKIMIELRRRDEYALFSEPVNVEDFPTYLETIGGEDKMMDLSTMQTKVDNNEYRTIDEVEVDIRMLVDAAQKFNPAGTVPYRSANLILTHGLKQIERARPLVLTPSPSPTRPSVSESGTPWRYQSENADIDPDPDAEVLKSSIPPHRRIPEEMLDFPPNSLQAKAIAWSLTGGKRTYIKRELRAKEKFTGKWRHWDLDGTRALPEMDDMDEVFKPSLKKKSRMMTDWRQLRKEHSWWDWAGPGGVMGQPPIAFNTKYPVRPMLPERELEWKEWGVFTEIEIEKERVAWSKAFRSSLRAADNSSSNSNAIEPDINSEEHTVAVLTHHLRPTTTIPGQNNNDARTPPPLTSTAINARALLDTYESRDADEWLHAMIDGDVRGAAYRQSVYKFIDGAVKCNYGRRYEDVDNGVMERGGDEADDDHEAIDWGLQAMQEDVVKRYNGGAFGSEVLRLVDDAVERMEVKPGDPAWPEGEGELKEWQRGRKRPRPDGPWREDTPDDDDFPMSSSSKAKAKAKPKAKAMAKAKSTPNSTRKKMLKAAWERTTLRHILRSANPLDISPFIKIPAEFMIPASMGLEGGMYWVGRMMREVEDQRKGKRISAATAKGAEAVKKEEDGGGQVTKKARVDATAAGAVGVLGEIKTAASSPLSTAPPSPPDSKPTVPTTTTTTTTTAVPIPTPTSTLNTNTETHTETETIQLDIPQTLHKIRLEILAVCKFYPLTGIKQLPKAVAEKILPPNVRGLLTIPEEATAAAVASKTK